MTEHAHTVYRCMFKMCERVCASKKIVLNILLIQYVHRRDFYDNQASINNQYLKMIEILMEFVYRKGRGDYADSKKLT